MCVCARVHVYDVYVTGVSMGAQISLCGSACTGMFELDVRVCGNVTEMSTRMQKWQKSHSFCITCTVHVANTVCHGRYRLVNGQAIFRAHKLIKM